MTGKAPFIALLIAILLGVGAWLSRTPQAPASTTPIPTDGPVASGAPAFQLDPGAVTAITRIAPGVPDQRVRRQDDGRWLFERASGAAWPTDSQAIYMLLRTMQEPRATGQVEPGAAPIDPVTVRFERAEAPDLVIEFDRETLGGNRLMRISEGEGQSRVALVNAALGSALVQPGPEGWRLQQALPGMGRDVSRVIIEREGARIVLARSAGQWTIREPFNLSADRATVEALLDALAKVSITRFFDDPAATPAPSATGLATPTLTITVERDVRVFDSTGGESSAAPEGSRVETRRRTLAIGSPFDAQAGTLFAASGDADATPVIVLIDGKAIDPAGLSEPLVYLARQPLTVAPSLVQRITLRDPASGELRTYFRGLKTWEVRAPDGALLRVLPADEAGEIDALLTALSAPALPTTDDSPYAAQVVIECSDRNGALLASLEAIPDATTAVIRNGPVRYRLAAPLPDIAWPSTGRR